MQQKRRSSAAAADTASRDGVGLLMPALLLRRCYRWRVLVPHRSRGLLRKADGVVVPAGALTCAVQRSARSWELGVASEMPAAEPGQGSGARSVLLFASRTRDAALVTDRRWDDVGYGCRVGWLSEYSESALRSALGLAGGGLDRLPIKVTGTNDLSPPT
jgi:hypothetical protein